MQVKQWSYSARALVGATILATSMVVAFPGPANAYTVPFKDPNISGSIGFCDQNRHQITSGSVYDKPFIWTAVSSAAAPTGYEHGKTVLAAYQPQKELDPTYWSGRQLTANSTFTNPRHPMAQATYADDPILFFTQQYPPKWDGLIEIRMYFSATNTPIHSVPYPATVIRVVGKHWTVVSDPGTAACTSGTAVSNEVRTLPRSVWASPKPLVVDGKVMSRPTTAAVAPSVTAQAAGTNPAGSTGSKGFASNLVVIGGILGVAVAGAAAAGVFVWRRRRIAPSA